MNLLQKIWESLQRKLVPIVIVLIIVGAFWYAFIYATFVSLNVPSGADSYRLTSAVSGAEVAKGSASSLEHIKRGSYMVRYYNKGTVVGVRLWKTGIVPFLNVKPADVTPVKATSTPFMGQSADYVTPLSDGSYLYVNKLTRGVEVVDSKGFHDISGSFNLSTGAGAGVYDSVVNIIRANDGSALVTTTRAVYDVQSQSVVTKLSNYTKNVDPNFYGSAYDTKTNSLFLLSAYDKTVYRFQLDQLPLGLQSFYVAKKQVQAVSAGNGRVVLYSNNFPTTDAAALKRYAQRVQTTPLILDASSNKQIANLGSFEAPTLVLPSASGDYVAIHEKFATTVHVYNTTSKKDVVLPGYDVSGIAWVGDKLYLARDNGIWLYDTSSAHAELAKVANIGASAARLTVTDSVMTISTIANIAETVNLVSSSVSATDPVVALSKIQLIKDDYRVTFDALGSTLYINTRSYSALKGDTIGTSAQQAIDTVKASYPELKATSVLNEGFTPAGQYLYATGE